MISKTQSTDASVLDELVDKICAMLQSGKQVDIDQLASQHPEMAQQLRKLYPTLLAINTLDATVSPIGSPNAIDKNHETQTLGDFQILRQIGRGGMGIVYEAQQLTINRKVALKILPLAALVDERALQRFKNEVAAIATLQTGDSNRIHPVFESCRGSVRTWVSHAVVQTHQTSVYFKPHRVFEKLRRAAAFLNISMNCSRVDSRVRFAHDNFHSARLP